MSWCTEGVALESAAVAVRSGVPGAATALASRGREPHDQPTRPSWPLLVDGDPPAVAGRRAEAPPRPGPLAPRGLLFDEADVARIAAAVAASSARHARAELETEVEARRAAALERVVASLAQSLEARAGADACARAQVCRLAEAIAQAFAGEGGGAPLESVARTVRAALGSLPDLPAARVVVDDLVLEPLRARLPDIAAAARFAGALEIVGDPRLALGGVRVQWAGGWLEHDPAHVRDRIAEVLAARRPADAAPAGAAPEPPEAEGAR